MCDLLFVKQKTEKRNKRKRRKRKKGRGRKKITELKDKKRIIKKIGDKEKA